MQDENHKVTLEGQRPEAHCPVKLKTAQPGNHTVLNAACESGTEGTLLQFRTTMEDLYGLMWAYVSSWGNTEPHGSHRPEKHSPASLKATQSPHGDSTNHVCAEDSGKGRPPQDGVPSRTSKIRSSAISSLTDIFNVFKMLLVCVCV